MTSRRNSLSQAKNTLMKVTLGFFGVFDFLENISGGDSKLEAAQKALKRSQMRDKALKKATRSVVEQSNKEEDDT